MITYEKIADKISSKIIDTLDDESMDTEKLSYGILVFFINITKMTGQTSLSNHLSCFLNSML